MKKIYYALSFFLVSSAIVSCSNDMSGADELIPTEQPTTPESNATRAFAEDDGAQSLPGMPAEKLYRILLGSDEAFSRRMGNYKVPTDEQYQEIKKFTDELVAGAANEGIVANRIYDWVRKNVSYANGYVSNEPYDVFINKKAVCQGYANLLNVMMHTQGIPVINSNGYMNNNGNFFGHAWNYVYYAGGIWRLLDPTNSIQHKAEELAKYQNQFYPETADGNFMEGDVYSYNYDHQKINLSAVKSAENAFVVPFSVTLKNGETYKIDCFNPTQDLPANVTEVYIGKNISSIGQDGIYGLVEHGQNVAAAYVDPESQYFESYEGVVYQAYSNSPLYIPTAMETLYLKPTSNGIIGKNFVCNHPNVLEIYFPKGTTHIENWAVENCPNLLVAYVPKGVEIAEKAFVGHHVDFEIIYLDETGIQDVIAD